MHQGQPCRGKCGLRPPLGLGTVDAIWVGSLVMVGVELGTAVSLALGIRLVQMLLVLSDGGAGLVILGITQWIERKR